MILLHCYGKQMVQITRATLLGAEAILCLRDSIWFLPAHSSNHSPLTKFSTSN